MKYLHTMIRVLDVDASLHFYCALLGLVETRRKDVEKGRFSLIFLGTDPDHEFLELTHNWDQTEPYSMGRNFGHIALAVDNIYDICHKLQDNDVTILRPPRDGRMAFVRCPDGISIELLQIGEPLAPGSPWTEMENTGSW